MSCVSSILFRELLTVRLLYRIIQYEVFKVHTRQPLLPNGDGGIRTLDPLLARQVLSQLSYTPIMGFHWLFNLFPNGLKWTRTTDLTLIRRAL